MIAFMEIIRIVPCVKDQEKWGDTVQKRHIEIDEDEVKRLYAEEGLPADQIANARGWLKHVV